MLLELNIYELNISIFLVARAGIVWNGLRLSQSLVLNVRINLRVIFSVSGRCVGPNCMHSSSMRTVANGRGNDIIVLPRICVLVAGF